jgi:2-hydroxychromene-2-carboxylate isomerase
VGVGGESIHQHILKEEGESFADQRQNLASFRDCERTYTPIFLGALMKATENTPPIQIINKGKWIGEDRLRWTRLFGIPMRDENPPDFPPRTLTVRAPPFHPRYSI